MKKQIIVNEKVNNFIEYWKSFSDKEKIDFSYSFDIYCPILDLRFRKGDYAVGYSVKFERIEKENNDFIKDDICDKICNLYKN